MDGSVAFEGETLTPAPLPSNPEKADPGALAALLPTGGTTGVPKIVPLHPSQHRRLGDGLDARLRRSDLRDRMVIVLPLFHVGGAFCGSLAALGTGARP